jgi:uncharacterized protein
MSRWFAPAKTMGSRWTAGSLLLSLLLAVSPARADTPDLDFHAPPAADDPTTPAVMRDLAERLLPVYQESDPDRYLANLSALQMVAGDFAAADVSRQTLRNRRRPVDAGRADGPAVIDDLYAYAKTIEAENHVSFAQAFSRAFNEVVRRLNDHDAYAVTRRLAVPSRVFRDALQSALDQQRTQDTISQAQTVNLIRKFLIYSAYRSFASLVGPLDAEDDIRRYAMDEEVLVKTPDGAGVAVIVVRPKNPAKALPALMELTLQNTQKNDAKECAAHGYVGVVAYMRRTPAGSRPLVPYQHDGDAARAVINWIAMQPWSDGRVGMYGDGYGGFSAWAAATRPPSALKAIATSAPTAPGIDVPMAGSIFQNSAYRWSLFVTTAKAAVEKSYYDEAHWRALDQKWYRSGRRYRDLGRLNRQPDPIFIRWLNHPSYDGFWQKMIPFGEQFAHINIPVLTTTGYFAASAPAALYYFTQHTQFDPHADHTLLIGPYDDAAMRRGAVSVLHGYQVDAAALIDLRELQYQWFDHILKGSATPPALMDRVNYEVMGANEWRHAATLEAMAGESQRFYLDAGSGERHRLTRRKPTKPDFVLQSVNLADRSDAAWVAPTELVFKTLPTHNDIAFVSEPLTKPTEFSGQFSGRLDFTVNKMDMDLNIALYERLSSGEYIRLFDPLNEFRASYAKDRATRHLLRAGERQELSFTSERITSRRLQAGSRLVMVLGINKRPDREINYGTGNDVSEESIADGKIPLKIHWHSGGYIDIPVRK